MQLFMKTSVVSVINLEKSMYLVLQALLVVCVLFDLSVGTSRPGQVRGHDLQSLWFEQKII